MNTKQFVKDALGWGFVLWLVGYVLGIIFFSFVPSNIVGWVIFPIGFIFTLWVLLKKIKSKTFGYYVSVGVLWTIVAVLFDYVFIVKFFKPADGYYKLDVYVYYATTFLLPLMVGWYKTTKTGVNKR